MLLEYLPVPIVSEKASQTISVQSLIQTFQKKTEDKTTPETNGLTLKPLADGRILIDAKSVPCGIAFEKAFGCIGFQELSYKPTEYASDLKGKIQPPVLIGDEHPDSVVASGATGYIQMLPENDGTVVKRAFGLDYGDGGEPGFIGARAIVHEANVLSALGKIQDANGSQNIVQLHGSGVTEQGEPFALLEHLKGGSLDDRIPEKSGLAPEQLSIFADGFLSGVAFLQRYNIIHQDLKSDNIMFRDKATNEPVIIDFDSATAHSGIAAENENGTTTGFIAGGAQQLQPYERFIPDGEMTVKIDSWAAGLLLLKATIGGNKHDQFMQSLHADKERGLGDQNKVDRLLNGALKDIPENYAQAIKGLLRVDIDERLSASEAQKIVTQTPPSSLDLKIYS